MERSRVASWRSGAAVKWSTFAHKGSWTWPTVSPWSQPRFYDLASLTKVVGLTTAVMFLVADGALDIDRPVVDFVPEFDGPGRNTVLVRNLLTHTSGLPAWVPFYEETPDADSALRRINGEPFENEPGTTYVYSDLGAILLAQVVERVSDRPARRVSRGAPVHTAGYAGHGLSARSPTDGSDRRQRNKTPGGDGWSGERSTMRTRITWEGSRGTPVSSRPRPISSASSPGCWTRFMGERTPRRPPYLPSQLVREFVRVQPGPEGSTRALGWDTPTPGGGASSGHLLSPNSFGHTGFTGTSIWVDTDREIFIILLTNRVHPTRDNRALLTIRGQVADKVMEALVERDGSGV